MKEANGHLTRAQIEQLRDAGRKGAINGSSARTDAQRSATGANAANQRWEQKRERQQYVMDYVRNLVHEEPKRLSKEDFDALPGDECIDINDEPKQQWISPCVDPLLAIEPGEGDPNAKGWDPRNETVCADRAPVCYATWDDLRKASGR